MAVPFRWEADHFDELIASAHRDEVVPYLIRWLDKRGPILEAGCGLGRFVAFMQDEGFQNVVGVEISAEAVAIINKVAPDLDVRCGDVSCLPLADASMRGVVSLGVVEHFEEGPRAALEELRRVMMPGATAIVTVPYLNLLRRLKQTLRLYALGRRIKRRRLKHGETESLGNVVSRSVALLPLDSSRDHSRAPARYARWPGDGPFFEYRFRRKEFEEELRAAGLSILQVAMIDTISGLFYELGRPFVRTDRDGRRLTRLGRVVALALSRAPGVHAHMILFAVRR